MSDAINHVWQSTRFAALAWLVVVTVLRNTRARTRYALWLTASVKFLVPFAALIALGKQFGWRKPAATPQTQVRLHYARDEVSQLATTQLAPHGLRTSALILRPRRHRRRLTQTAGDLLKRVFGSSSKGLIMIALGVKPTMSVERAEIRRMFDEPDVKKKRTKWAMNMVKPVLLALLTSAIFAQEVQFDVASVKAHAAGQLGISKITTDPGLLRAESVDLKQLIGYAYDVSPLVIAGNLPATRFDVEGKAESSHTRAELRLMLQSLLADRFGLRVHRETRELTVDALVVGKSPKFQTSNATDPDPRGFVLRAGKLPGHIAAEGHAITLPGLANYLSNGHHDRLIVDATGLKGVYDFSVDYEIDTEKVLDRNVPVSDAKVSLFEDLARALGLKIESGRRLPVEMLVIDQILPPDPN